MEVAQIPRIFALEAIVVGVLACVAYRIFSSRLVYRMHLSQLPILSISPSSEERRKAFLGSCHQLYLAGYEKFKDVAYRMPTSDGHDTIVIPPRLIPEFGKLSDSVASMYPAAQKILETQYTNVLTDLSLIAHTVRANLTPALARLNPIVYMEADQAMREEMPECEDWTPIPAYTTVVHMVAKITGRIFVGPDLCRSPDYLDSAVNYALDVLKAQKEIKLIHPLLRPILASRLASVRRLREREKTAGDFFGPIVQARLDAEASDPHWQEPDDMLSSLMSSGEDHGVLSATGLAKMQLGIIFAAVHTTSESMTHIMYDLAVRREYIEPLREEIRAVMAEQGGTITTRGLQQMLKLDSFMRESLRLHPPLTTTSHREVIRGFNLSNGQYIPAGATIELPSRAVYRDPQNYPDGDTFDGFRHYRRRQSGTARDHARNQFVTSNEQSLMFGYGRHACPGRFFAANEIKMLLAKFILDFDFKNEDGSLERYADIEIGALIAPDTKKKLLFKRVATA